MLMLGTHMEIYPRTEVKIYGFFGPYAEIVSYVKGNYKAKLQSQITPSGSETFLAWDSSIDVGLDFRVGTELTFLWGLLNKEFGPTIVPCFETPLWKSPTEITLLIMDLVMGEAKMILQNHWQQKQIGDRGNMQERRPTIRRVTTVVVFQVFRVATVTVTL